MNANEQNKNHDQTADGPKVLSHDAVKGYRPVFYLCITLGMLYLSFVFWQSW